MKCEVAVWTGPLRRHAVAFEVVSVDVPEVALQAYEVALSRVCDAVGFFLNDETGDWRIEGVKPVGHRDPKLSAAVMVAAALTGVEVTLQRASTPALDWLALMYASFPQQVIGQRFAIRGTHVRDLPMAGRITLTLDAGLAFGSGEHGSTRGCLRALEQIAWRRPQRILDLGTGSGILAMAAARLLRRPVLAIDIEQQSVQVAQQNVILNRLRGLVRVQLADGWRHPLVQAYGPYDLVMANILARPLCLMARHLARYLSRGGTAVLSGLLQSQARTVLAAHVRHGLQLDTRLYDGPWTTLLLRKRSSSSIADVVPDVRAACRARWAENTREVGMGKANI